jgi:hypothetical protein
MWRPHPAVARVEHVDGRKTRLLCPSCHAQRLEIWSDWLEHELLYAVPPMSGVVAGASCPPIPQVVAKRSFRFVHPFLPNRVVEMFTCRVLVALHRAGQRWVEGEMLNDTEWLSLHGLPRRGGHVSCPEKGHSEFEIPGGECTAVGGDVCP